MMCMKRYVRISCILLIICYLTGMLSSFFSAEAEKLHTRATTPSEDLLEQINADTAVPRWGYEAQNAILKFKNRTPMSIAHRAVWKYSSENSLVAIHDSITLGIDAVELDVMLSADGVVVLSHDTTIDRCTNGKGTVSELNWDSLRTAALVTGLGTGDETGYILTAAQAQVLNSLPDYVTHYGGAAVEGGTHYVARFDDALDLVKAYGPNTYITPDKLSNDTIFSAVYKITREKGMLNNVMFKFSRSPETLNLWAQKAAETWNASYPNDIITQADVKNSIILMYVVGSPSVSALQKHLDNGTYLKAVEISYSSAYAESYEKQIASTYAPFCKTNDLALYAVTIGPDWAGGRYDTEATWAHYLSLGFTGFATDRPDEMAVYLYHYNRTRGTTETVQGEHFSSYKSSTIFMNEAANINRNKVVKGLYNGDYLAYHKIKFNGKESKIYFRARGLQNGAKLNFYVGSIASSNLVASSTVPVSDGVVSLDTDITKTLSAGTYTFYVQVEGSSGKELIHFDCYAFQPENHYLLFDFDPSADNKERYEISAYGGLDYTDVEAWHSNDPETIADGYMTIDITGSDKSYHYIRTGKEWNDIPLKYNASRNAYCQIRFKLDNVVVADTSVDPQFALYYFFDESNNPKASYYNFKLEDYNNKGFFTITMPLNKFSGEVKALRAFFNNIKTADSGKSTITYDYFYVGPIEPDESVLFTFDNSQDERSRYRNSIYGNTDYTNVSNWWYRGTRSTKPSISNGAISFSILSNYSGTYHYIQSSPNNNMGKMPMKYTAGTYDFCQIRFKIDNAVISDPSYGTSLHLYFAPDNGDTGNRRQVSVTFDIDRINNNGYHILTFPMNTAPYLDTKYINAFRPMFNNLKSESGKQACFTIDYLYVGPEENLPTKHNNETIVTAPTCTTQGYSTHTCKTCGYTFHDSYLDPLGHSYSYKATKNPTTSATGTLTGTCSKCSGTTTATLPKLNTTDYTKTTTTAATCTATGMDKYTWKTTTYGTFSFNATTAALGHSYTTKVTAPTCTAQGYTTHTCSRCSDSYKDTYTNATGHSYTYKATKNPTTSATGTLTGTCSKCSGTTTVTLPKLNTTDYTKTTTTAATCTTTGVDKYTWKTTTYGSFSFNATTAALGHSYTAKVTAPTCTAQGYTTHTCSRCSDSYMDTYTNATGHSYTYKATKNPTTSATGTLTGTCSKCSGTTTVTLPKLNTTDYTKTTTTAATCTGTGVDKYTWKTTTYGTFSFNVTTAAKGHTSVTDPAVAPTCTATGKTAGSHCSVCNTVLTAQTTVAALGHSYTTKVTSPTCTAQGYTTHTCSRCSNSYKDTYTNATGHSYSYKATKNPTTSATGTLTGTCSKCSGTTTVTLPKLNTTDYTKTTTTAATCTATGVDKYTWKTTTYGTFSFNTTTAALGHSYSAKVTAPTCTAQGYTTHTCSRCSDSYKDTYTNATGHSYSYKATKNPTTSATGTLTGTCSKCSGTTTVTLPKLNTTDYTKTTTTAATCTATGVDKYTWKTTTYGTFSFNVTTAAKGHTSVTDPAVAPTCTATGKTAGSHCSVCNTVLTAQTTVAALGHSYTAKVTAPTCTAQGYTTHTCSRCSNSYKDTYTNATGHSYSYKATKNPTTSATGTLTGTCSKCSGTTTVTLPKLNTTDYTKTTTTAATCTATGVDKYTWKTTTYGTFSFNATTAALGHSYTAKVTAPTCTAQGYTTHTCSRCSDSYKDTYTNATGHSYTTKVTAPTCTAQGYTTHTCSRCSHSYKDTYVAAKGHTEVIDKAVAATCTTAGKTEGKHCSVCNAVIVAQQTVPAKGHTEVIDKAVAATCTTAGKTEGKHCSVCNAVLVAQQTVPAKGHTEVIDKAVVATCTAAGKTEGKHCSVCDAVLVAQQTIPAKGHTEVIDEAVAATCTTAGKTEGKHCSVCDAVIVAQETVPAKGHTEVIDKAVAATCTTAGKTEGKHCSVCNAVLVAQETVPAKGHTEVIDKAVAATCTTAGKTEGKHCSVCSAILVAQQTVPAKGHTEVIDKAVAATCTAAGKTEGKHCSVCNAVLVAQQTVPAKGHTEVIDKAVAATCTTAGKTEGKHCSVCITVLVAQETVPAKGHTEVIDKAVAATCTAAGKTEGKHCSVCNAVLVAQETVPAKGHTEVIDKAVAATCTTSGKTEGKHCSVCSAVLVAQQTVPAKGHTEVIDKAVAATCTADGRTEGKHCSVCDAVLVAQQTIPAMGHTEVIDKAVAATCTAAGKTEGKHCTVCSAVLVAQQTVPATGHSYIYTKIDALTHKVTCRNCNYSASAAHSYKDGFCICGEPEVKEPIEEASLKLNHSLNLASDISVNLLISKTLLEGFDMSTVYVESKVDCYEGNRQTGTSTIRIEPVENGNYYYFTLNGLTAVQMNDKISSVIYGAKNGQPYYSPVDVYSIATYAYSQLNHSDRPEALKILCADLLRYGAKAQIFKSYRTDALADANMTAAHRAYLSDMDSVTFGNTNKILNDLENAPISWAGKALDLESKVALKFVFDPANYEEDLSKLTLRVEYTDIHGATKTLILENPSLYNPDRMLYAFTLDALLAAELRTVVSVQIFAGNIPVSCTLQYSADTYGNNKTGKLLELCKALFAYSDSARSYFA